MTYASHSIDLRRLNSVDGEASDWVASHSLASWTTFWAFLGVVSALLYAPLKWLDLLLFRVYKARRVYHVVPVYDSIHDADVTLQSLSADGLGIFELEPALLSASSTLVSFCWDLSGEKYSASDISLSKSLSRSPRPRAVLSWRSCHQRVNSKGIGAASYKKGRCF